MLWAGNQTRVLWESSPCSLPLSHLFTHSDLFYFFNPVFPLLLKVELTAKGELLSALWLITVFGVGVGDKLGRGSHSEIRNVMLRFKLRPGK